MQVFLSDFVFITIKTPFLLICHYLFRSEEENCQVAWQAQDARHPPPRPHSGVLLALCPL